MLQPAELQGGPVPCRLSTKRVCCWIWRGRADNPRRPAPSLRATACSLGLQALLRLVKQPVNHVRRLAVHPAAWPLPGLDSPPAFRPVSDVLMELNLHTSPRTPTPAADDPAALACCSPCRLCTRHQRGACCPLRPWPHWCGLQHGGCFCCAALPCPTWFPQACRFCVLLCPRLLSLIAAADTPTDAPVVLPPALLYLRATLPTVSD